MGGWLAAESSGEPALKEPHGRFLTVKVAIAIGGLSFTVWIFRDDVRSSVMRSEYNRNWLIDRFSPGSEGDSTMSMIPAKPTPQPPPTETVEERFRRLEKTWLDEIGYSSSPDELRSHWAFQEIVSMGDSVVPLMLRDLEQEPHFWVWALRRITGADPVPVADRGNITKMSEAWVRWGKEQGYQRSASGTSVLVTP
jgi:hypothetical protein